MDTGRIDPDDWRAAHYNARIELAQRVHEDLLILRVRPNAEKPAFVAGQYTTLGLGDREPRADGVVRPADGGPAGSPRLIRRAYSMSCPMLDERGELVTCDDVDYLEFYVVLVRRPTDDPPSLTPRLFALRAGDRLHLGPHPHGSYTLAPVGPNEDVLFFATGTGEAPHNAMIAELLARGHSGRIVVATCVRQRRDLAYLDVHRRLSERFDNYRYFPLTTREPENLDASRPDFVGKRYLQDFVSSGSLEREIGPIDLGRTHAFLCGSPAMIGLPGKEARGEPVFPEPPGMVEILTHRGFQLDQPRRQGNIHVEKYW